MKTNNKIEKNKHINFDSEKYNLLRYYCDKILFARNILISPPPNNSTEDFLARNIQFNLYNKNWLADYIYIKLSITSKDFTIEQIIDFIYNSDYINEKRAQIEKDMIIKIINKMKNNLTGWVLPDEFDDTIMLYNPDCDLIFREAIIKNCQLRKIPLDLAIKVIDENSDIWLDWAMECAFNNRYEPFYLKNRTNIQLPELEQNHKENWLLLRKLKYMEEHSPLLRFQPKIVETILKEHKSHIIKLKAECTAQNYRRKKILELYMKNLHWLQK